MRLLALITAVTAGPAGPAMLDIGSGEGYWPITGCGQKSGCAAWKIATKESSIIFSFVTHERYWLEIER